MKFIAIILLSIASFTVSFAQVVSWSPEYGTKKGENIEKLCAQDKDGIYVLRSLERGAYRQLPVLDLYDKQMKLKYSRILKELDKSTIFYTDLFHFNNRLFITFTKYKFEEKTHTLYYNELDKTNGELVGTPKKIGAIQSDRKLLQGEFQFAASPDSSKALIFFSEVDTERTVFRNPYDNFDGSPNQFNLTVYDLKMNQLWEQKVRIPYDEDLMERKELSIDNEGNVHVLAKVYEGRAKDKKDGKVNYTYKLFSFYQGDGTKEYTFDLGENYISEITLRPNRKGELICAGFYSEKGAEGLRGSFYLTIDEKTREMSKKKFQAFSPAFMAKIIGERRANKGRELNSFVMRNLILRSDNGAVLVAEQAFTRVVSNNNYSHYYRGGYNPYSRDVTYYHFNDIILINLNPDGTIAWLSAIPKEQVSTTTEFSSFAMATVRDKLHFVFNDRISKRSAVRLATVNSKGEMSIKDLFENRDADVITQPKLSRQVARNEMVIYGSLNNRFRFAKLIL